MTPRASACEPRRHIVRAPSKPPSEKRGSHRARHRRRATRPEPVRLEPVVADTHVPAIALAVVEASSGLIHHGEPADTLAELTHAARWNEMGMMAATLAHELNQPLTAATNFVEAARQMLATGPEHEAAAREALGSAALQMRQAAAIIATLREFIDKRETSQMLEDLNSVVEGAITLGAGGAARLGTEVETDLAPALPRVLINKVQIQQVLVNLFRNAFEAMRGARRRVLRIVTALDGRGFVTVAVSDTGPGIEPRLMRRLFQPFATSKQDGMGLGLRICQSIVEAHEGKIWVTANADAGVAFRFRLPVG